MFSDMLFTAVCPLKDLQRFVVFKIISIVCTVLSFDYGKRIADVFEDFIKIRAIFFRVSASLTAPFGMSHTRLIFNMPSIQFFLQSLCARLTDIPQSSAASCAVIYSNISIHKMRIFIPQKRKTTELYTLSPPHYVYKISSSTISFAQALMLPSRPVHSKAFSSFRRFVMPCACFMPSMSRSKRSCACLSISAR